MSETSIPLMPRGQAYFRPIVVAEVDISRRRRRRLRGKRKDGRLPSWKLQKLGDIDSFVFELTVDAFRSRRRISPPVATFVDTQGMARVPVSSSALVIPRYETREWRVRDEA